MRLKVGEIYPEVLSKVCNAFDQLDWSQVNVYSYWLVQAHHLVSYTTRLLSLCAGVCTIDQEDLHHRLLSHIREEAGHDQIAQADLQHLGVAIDFDLVLAETRRLIELQYTTLRQTSAPAFFGYILLLEGLAVERGRKLYEKVAGLFGPRCGRFLHVHAMDDIAHIEQALSVIETFTANDTIQLIDNLQASSNLYIQMLQRVHLGARQFKTDIKAHPAYHAEHLLS